MNVKRLDHIGVIVDDLNEAKEFIGKSLGLTVSHSVESPDLEGAFLKCGDVFVEVIEVRNPEMRKARLGEGNRARIEHIAFEVEDLAQTIALMEGLGVQMTAPPRISGEYLTCWTKAEGSDGVMYQFMQKA